MQYVGWFSHDRLHEALGDVPPAEFEQLHAAQAALSANGSVTVLAARTANGRYATPA